MAVLFTFVVAVVFFGARLIVKVVVELLFLFFRDRGDHGGGQFDLLNCKFQFVHLF